MRRWTSLPGGILRGEPILRRAGTPVGYRVCPPHGNHRRRAKPRTAVARKDQRSSKRRKDTHMPVRRSAVNVLLPAAFVLALGAFCPSAWGATAAIDKGTINGGEADFGTGGHYLGSPSG